MVAISYNSKPLWLNCFLETIQLFSPQSCTTDMITKMLLVVNCCSYVKVLTVCPLSVCTVFRLDTQKSIFSICHLKAEALAQILCTSCCKSAETFCLQMKSAQGAMWRPHCSGPIAFIPVDTTLCHDYHGIPNLNSRSTASACLCLKHTVSAWDLMGRLNVGDFLDIWVILILSSP